MQTVVIDIERMPKGGAMVELNKKFKMLRNEGFSISIVARSTTFKWLKHQFNSYEVTYLMYAHQVEVCRHTSLLHKVEVIDSPSDVLNKMNSADYQVSNRLSSVETGFWSAGNAVKTIFHNTIFTEIA